MCEEWPENKEQAIMHEGIGYWKRRPVTVHRNSSKELDLQPIGYEGKPEFYRVFYPQVQLSLWILKVFVYKLDLHVITKALLKYICLLY